MNQNASSSEWDCIKTTSKTKILSKGEKTNADGGNLSNRTPWPSSAILKCLDVCSPRVWRENELTTSYIVCKAKENFYQGSHFPKPDFFQFAK